RFSEELARWVEFGVSPRGTISLDRCARAYAWIKGKDFVSPQDVSAVIHDVYRHRILLSFDAEAEGVSINDVIDHLLSCVPVA
ncbi:AAA family ATPase, partial [Oleiphilus sp. HI0066]|uniref:AAA family ATPase n=2 Tax=Oleiphilus TaxID=141450 RepID=UPI000AC0FE25